MIDTFRESCVNWQLDASTCSLNGICKLTDDSREASHPKLHGWRETSLDLNNCIWYDAKASNIKWFEVNKDGKVEDLSGTANFCRDFCDCWIMDGGVSQDLMACHCDSGEHRRSRLSALNLSKFFSFSLTLTWQFMHGWADSNKKLNGLRMGEDILSVLVGRGTKERLGQYWKPSWSRSCSFFPWRRRV
ncbi:hypothetical protein B0T20DRAFT_414857 [Sordaria brevicollis]|uniref:Cyanovirin-N domain-containing protein n=1 Tax=Sordaria brevicollis TaxID=83679 RepID=A0AAE0PBP2_SORBR|nr:hypothetical protein B0T20DRAFT_414857 [Sordaria brevicollis]